MELKNILEKCDHTLLRVDCTSAEIKTLCDQAIKYNCASVCIPPCHVAGAKRYVGDKLKICTVIGFPNGYNTAFVKCAETDEAVKNGADEIDMVINIGDLKAGNYDKILSEINAVKKECGGKILKVIIETCLLTENEKIKMCEIISKSRADFIKTSTGFAGGGATFDDIILFKKHCAPHIKIKAAGGISSLEDAETFLSLGASRLGTSRIVAIAKTMGI